MPTYDARAWLGVTRSRRDAGRHASTEYAISVTAPDPATGLAHIVRAWRRYGEFDRLRKRLIAEAPDEIVSKLPFPSSRTLRKNSDSVRRRRQEQLNTWWQTIITMDAPAVTRQLDQFAVFEIRELMQAEEDARLADIRGSSLDLIVQGAGWNDLSVGRQNLYTPLGVAHQRLAFAKVTHSRVGDPYLQARWDNDVLQEIAKLLVSTLGRHGNLWFEYDGIPFGQSGLLYHLGTAANSHPWSNPCGWRHKRAPLTGVLGMNTIAGVTHYGASAPQRLLRDPIPTLKVCRAGGAGIECAWSSVSSLHVQRLPNMGTVGRCSVESFVSRQPMYPLASRTMDERNSWMAFDLGPSRRFAVDHYALRNDGYGRSALRSWKLQGADKMAGPWVTLRRHDHDRSLSTHEFGSASWSVDPNLWSAGGRSFRCFRILQHGRNAEGHYELQCGGIELYGALRQL